MDKTRIANLIISKLKLNSIIPSSLDWATSHGIDHQDVVRVLLSLSSKNIISGKLESFSKFVLTEEGEAILQYGSPEYILWESCSEPVSWADVAKLLNVTIKNAKIVISSAIKLKLVRPIKDTDTVCSNVEHAEDIIREQCRKLQAGCELDKSVLDTLKRRKYAASKVFKYYEITVGPEFEMFDMEYATELTEDMVAKGSWKSMFFKKYNFDALGAPIKGGYLHPLSKMRREFREIFLQMGFEEMSTSRYVESSFWNFDALYQPQFHPTRDPHDTFFIKDPSVTAVLPESYVQEVGKLHQMGGFESLGYRYKWLASEARKNVLRTHTTGISANLLYHLAQKYKATNVLEPKKYFSIDRVFRNESIDQTHLAEFHQCEGIVIGWDLTLADLINIISSFFTKQGLTKLKFKPAYNPYTEPSMEVYAYHPELGKFVEIGNSGIFRPEMLLPMGFPKSVTVLGWGVSLERPAMIKYKLKDIRKLMGPEVSYSFIKNNPICRLDKFNTALDSQVENF